MNKIKILSSILLVGLIAGCAQKEESISFDNNKKVSQDEKIVSGDEKLSKIKTIADNKGVVESNEGIAHEANKKSSPSYMNETTSIIDGSSITLKSIHFGFDMYNLTEEMQMVSSNNYTKMKDLGQTNDNFKVKLEGNCDEWGTDEYNYALGLKRTKTVKKDLIRNGMPADRIVVVSYGESNPLCTEQTAQCWKKNRRVDYKLLP